MGQETHGRFVAGKPNPYLGEKDICFFQVESLFHFFGKKKDWGMWLSQNMTKNPMFPNFEVWATAIFDGSNWLIFLQH